MVYIKDSLAAKLCNISRLGECVIIELTINNKKGYVMSLYRSPSQTHEEFEQFLENFDHTLNHINSLNPSFVIILGDFNAKSSSWYANDITSNEGFNIENITSFYGFCQLISSPTHILPTSSSCIDLIFTDQPSIILNSGVHSSLHPNCHHQIIFTKINLKIEFHSPYKRLVWDYKNGNIDYINQSINIFNIFKKFIRNKVKFYNDSDPPWITDKIKRLITLKNQMFKIYLRNGKKSDEYELLQSSTQQLESLIQESRTNYFNHLSAKLSDPKSSSKAYWKILKPFVNGKKIPSIPPILFNGESVSNF